jgi:phage-related holin
MDFKSGYAVIAEHYFRIVCIAKCSVFDLVLLSLSLISDPVRVSDGGYWANRLYSSGERPVHSLYIVCT